MATAQDNLARKQIFIPALQSEAAQLRVATYCRVSTDSDDQLNSFAAQQTYYNEYIRKHEGWQMADIYADEGITGTSAAKRDDFQRMLYDCRKGRIDKILVKSISRFARNTKECLEYIRELKALGISVFFEEHNIDTRMVTSEMLTAVLASCAQADSESISKNMSWSVQRRMQKGTFNTCRAGTGFLLSKDGLAIRPEAVPVIQSIYMDYVSGINSREISNRLTAEKALGRVWNRTLVDYILTNERYAGNALLQKKYRTDTFPRVKKPNRGERPMYYVEDSNPAMIDQELFDQAAELRKSRRRDAANGQARPFAKKLYCQCCGSLLRSKKTNGTWYWVCRTHEESAEKCPLPPIPEDEIIRAILRLYYNLRNHQEILTFLLRQERKIRIRQMLWGADIVGINKRISDIISQSHKLTVMQKSGNVDPDIFIAKSNQLAEQLRKAKQQKETLQTQEDNDLIESTSQMLEAISAGPDMLEAFNAELFCELIERITIQNNTKIRFRLKNGLELPESIERTVRQMGRNRKQPFGYGMEKGKVVIHTGESTWVKHFYREYNAGVPMRALAEYMQGTGVSYEEGKKWNINMIARILSDERYIGIEGYPEIIEKDMFKAAAEKREKKAPAVQRTEAQKVLRRKCGCRVTPYIEHEVLYLLNTLAGNPEHLEVPKAQKQPDTELRILQSELSDMMETLPVDEKQTREKLLEVTMAMYEAIDPSEYETHRMRRVFGNEQRRSELNAHLISQNVSAVMVESTGKVRVKLKNNQILERRECSE